MSGSNLEPALPPLVILIFSILLSWDKLPKNFGTDFCHQIEVLLFKILALSVRRTTRVIENTPVDTPDVSPLISRGLGTERSRPNKTQFNEVFYVY